MTELDDVPVVLPALVDVERDASDATDSREFLRESSDGLRGGRAGARAGKGGGTLGFWTLIWVVDGARGTGRGCDFSGSLLADVFTGWLLAGWARGAGREANGLGLEEVRNGDAAESGLCAAWA